MSPILFEVPFHRIPAAIPRKESGRDGRLIYYKAVALKIRLQRRAGSATS